MVRRPKIIMWAILLLIFVFGIYMINNSLQGDNGKPISKKYLPDTNTTCESLIPKNVTVKLGYTGSAGQSPNGLVMAGYTSTCNRNTQVGQRIDEFTCIADKDVKDRVSSDNVILRDYRLRYSFLLRDSNCTRFSSRQLSELSQDFLDCEVIQSSCDWAYE